MLMPKRGASFSVVTPAKKLKINVPGGASAPMVSRRRGRKLKYGQKGPEIKFIDTLDSGTTASTTANVFGLNTIAQGNTNSTRVGNKIQIKSVEMSIHMSCDPNVAHVANLHRVAIILDKEPEAGGIAAYTDVFVSNDILGYRTIGNSDRFVVLAVEDFTTGVSGIGANTVWATGDFSVYKRRYVKCDVAAKYNGTTAAQASIASNQIFAVTISEVTDANIDWLGRFRVRFTDE